MKRLAIAGLLGAACLGIAYRAGGGADAVRPAPHPAVAASVPADAAAVAVGAPVAYEVHQRLLEALATARVEISNDPAAKGYFNAYWRKMRPQWARAAAGGPIDTAAFPYATSIALRVSATETVFSSTLDGGRIWKPDVRLWNMNEGSFDQREALWAPAPASYRFPVQIPPKARFEVSAGIANEPRGEVRFQVLVTAAGEAEKIVHDVTFGGKSGRGWHDIAVDLAAFGGKSATLELRTSFVAKDLGETGGGGDGGGKEIAPENRSPGVPAALWGNPTLLVERPAQTGYNVLWIVVDALRPDVLASFHDDAEDAAIAQAATKPLEARLPKVPGLMEHLDGFGARATRFVHAYSSASWTRPGTIGMLTGAPTSALGVDATRWGPDPNQIRAVYTKTDPFLGTTLRRRGVFTAGFVNNFFMAGYTPIGLDMGFERLVDHRYRTKDTDAITTDADAWIRAHKDARFFTFVNYNSPHDPIDPLPEFIAKVPKANGSDKLDDQVRGYMAEAAKDDRAIGKLLATLDETGLAKNTIVVVTADHGETLSSAHSGIGLEKSQIRFHHAAGHFEETVRIPILLFVPGKKAQVVKTRVSSIDIVPTLSELLGVGAPTNSRGRSLVGALDGKPLEERAFYTEGRALQGYFDGTLHYIASDTEKGRLFDLATDPGERVNLSNSRSSDAQRLASALTAFRAELKTARAEAAPTVAPTTAPPQVAEAAKPANVAAPPPVTDGIGRVQLRFSAGGKPHRVDGTLTLQQVGTPLPISLPAGTWSLDKGEIRFSFALAEKAMAGFDFPFPATAKLGGTIRWDGREIGARLATEPALYHVGPFALAPAKELRTLKIPAADDGLEALLRGPTLPEIDPARDEGVFVVRSGAGAVEAAAAGNEGAAEMDKVLRDWGYAHGSH